jgi:hypothetical protein
MGEKVFEWFSWIDESRLQAAWEAVFVIALIPILRIPLPIRPVRGPRRAEARRG